MIEDRIYTTDELVEMGIYTTDFEFMDKPCEVVGTLLIKGAARKGMFRLFFLLEDGREIITPVFSWQRYLGALGIPVGTRLRLTYAAGAEGKTYLKKMDPLPLPTV